MKFEMADTALVNQYDAEIEEFLAQVLDCTCYFVSDESTVSDFITEESEGWREKAACCFGIHTEQPDPYLYEIGRLIRAERTPPPA